MAAPITELKYKLNKKDIYRAMKQSGYYKTVGVRRVVENVLLGVFTVIFGYSFFEKGDVFNLVMAIICLVMMALIIFVPNSDMAHKSARLAEQKEFSVQIFPHSLMVSDGEQRWELPLDGSCRCKVVDKRLLAIMTPEKQLIVLPLEAIPQEHTAAVQTAIYEGTEAY